MSEYLAGVPLSKQNSHDELINPEQNSKIYVNLNNNDDNVRSLVSKDDPQEHRLMEDTSHFDPPQANTSANLNSHMRLALLSPVSNTSMKELKKNYHQKKKYFTKNVQCAIESTQEVHSGWLKARTTFKRWTKTWCQVKPGYLILYTSQEAQKKHRLGVVLLSVCQIIKRPTKKEGFCFKLINPFGCSVWAKSSTKAIIFAQASLTLRVSDESIGKLWLDALYKCQLSSNLEGYQPIIHEDRELRGSGANSRFDDTGCEGDSSGEEGGKSVNQLEYILNNSTSASDSNSFSSSQRLQINNNPIRQIKARLMKNGVTPLKNSFRSHKSNDFSLSAVSDTQTKKLGRDNQLSNQQANKVIREQMPEQQHGTNSASASQFQFETNILGDGGFGKDQLINRDSSNLPLNGGGSSMNMNCFKMVTKFSKYSWKDLQLESLCYKEDGAEELGIAGMQSEEVHESNKNFLWHIIKQLRPGMDLSKVTLPTFILEPRSFLEKLADYYYHCDILSEAVLIDDPVQRLLSIVKWYLSGFYKKPKGPKKPYNPILGEKFRCFWDHPKTKSRTFFIAEQVSHHPPVSAFHVANRKDGYTITCALLSRSKYGGNSVSAILDGKARMYLNKRNETYTITMPYANCRGILLGSLCLELGGKVEIECAETQCKCELDFRLASMWANQSSYNALTGKILKDNKVLYTLDGHWDRKIFIVNKSTDRKSTLWEVNEAIRNSRLRRYTVDFKDQGERESVKLWSKVTEALIAGNQVVATTEKTRLEDMQRKEARDRQGSFKPRHFQQASSQVADWFYKWQDDRPWDDRRDIMQFEEDFVVRTLMLSPTEVNETQSSVAKVPHIDLPLTQLSKFASQIQGPDNLTNSGIPRAVNGHGGSSNSVKGTLPDVDLSESTMRDIESRIAAGNLLFEEALKQVKEKNRKLEEDIATLKRARGKRTMALILTAIVIAIVSAFYKFLS